MGRTVLTAQNPAIDGRKLIWTAGDTANGLQFTNTGRETLLVWNTHAAAARTIGIPSGGELSGVAVGDISQSIVAGDIWHFGPFPKYLYDQIGTDEVQTITPTGTISGGHYHVTFGGVTSGEIAYNANAAATEVILEAMSSIGVDNVYVTGGPISTTPVVLTFKNTLGRQNVAQCTLTSSLSGGGTIAIATTTAGVPVTSVANLVFLNFPANGSDLKLALIQV